MNQFDDAVSYVNLPPAAAAAAVASSIIVVTHETNHETLITNCSSGPISIASTLLL